MKRILTILAAAAVIAGCAKSPEDQIVGVWYDSDEEVTAQFYDDGTIIVEDGDDRLSGNYRILDEENIELELSAGGSESMTLTAGYELSGDTLILIAPDGDRSVMRRQD